MIEDRNVHQAPSPHARLGTAAALVTAATLALAPLVVTMLNPAAVEARLQEAVPEPCDFTTSGGYVVTDAGRKANFGVHGGCKNGGFWGHLNFVDHATGYHVNSVEITAYVAPFGTDVPVRDVCGIASTNHPSDPEYQYFRTRLMDNGEPGGLDQFALKLENGYWLTQRELGTAKPGAGNVRLHAPNDSTTRPLVDVATACGGLTFDDPPE
jgi:hypothetical protein